MSSMIHWASCATPTAPQPKSLCSSWSFPWRGYTCQTMTGLVHQTSGSPLPLPTLYVRILTGQCPVLSRGRAPALQRKGLYPFNKRPSTPHPMLLPPHAVPHQPLLEPLRHRLASRPRHRPQPKPPPRPNGRPQPDRSRMSPPHILVRIHPGRLPQRRPGPSTVLPRRRRRHRTPRLRRRRPDPCPHSAAQYYRRNPNASSKPHSHNHACTIGTHEDRPDHQPHPARSLLN
jgi:hypothetical protein